MGSHVFGEEGDDETRDESEDGAEEGVDWAPASDDMPRNPHLKGSRVGEDGGEVDDSDEDDGGDEKLDFEGGFNFRELGDGAAEDGDDGDQEADNNPEGDEEKGVEEVAEVEIASSSHQGVA